MGNEKQYQLNPHCQELLHQYEEHIHIFQRMETVACDAIEKALKDYGLYVNAIEHRIKRPNSLAGKLQLKGQKYHTLSDLTDLFGLRIITFYTDDVDKVAAIAKQVFDVDWKESIDKRKAHNLTNFGYNSLHYICRLPKTLVDDPSMPELNEFRFELQMRTALQHVWSTIEHDIGYKGEVKMSSEYMRQFSRLAGTLVLIDDEFSRLRTTMNDYRRKVQQLVNDGQLDEVALTTESFRSFLKLNPFDRLNRRIAAVNQAEIYPTSLMSFLPVLLRFRLETLGDLQQFIEENSEDAYQYALDQLAITDLDILSESIGLQSLCIVCALKKGNGRETIKHLFDVLYGASENNWSIADLVISQAAKLPFMRQ